MDLIAWQTTGEITDMPSCVHPILSRLVHRINDARHMTVDDRWRIVTDAGPLLVGTDKWEALRAAWVVANAGRTVGGLIDALRVGADLVGANLTRANLVGANLAGANPRRGPTSSGPTSPGPTSPGPTSPRPTSPGPTSSGPTSPGPASPEPKGISGPCCRTAGPSLIPVWLSGATHDHNGPVRAGRRRRTRCRRRPGRPGSTAGAVAHRPRTRPDSPSRRLGGVLRGASMTTQQPRKTT